MTRPRAERLAQRERERDRGAERIAALADAYARYEVEAESAWQDYRAESNAVWLRWRQRLDGATAEYASTVEAIRAAP